MTDWTPEHLQKIATSGDLHVSPFREDGVTYGKPTWIWSVVVDGALFVRAYNGRESRWSRPRCGRRPGASAPPE
jgi:hypothetical protein